jgi:hypothetical protein
MKAGIPVVSIFKFFLDVMSDHLILLDVSPKLRFSLKGLHILGI